MRHYSWHIKITEENIVFRGKRYEMITKIKKQITEITDRDPLTERIIACAYKVHTEIGPGFNEKIYHNALKLIFESEGLRFETEKGYEVCFQDKRVGMFRVDLVVENSVVVEVKAVIGGYAKGI